MNHNEPMSVTLRRLALKTPRPIFIAPVPEGTETKDAEREGLTMNRAMKRNRNSNQV